MAEFLTAQGYDPNKTFNAMHGDRRLLFYDEPNGRQIDVFVGTFEMCHQLPLEQRLEIEPMTLPLADLALTKLQIVKLNRKRGNVVVSRKLAIQEEVNARKTITIEALHEGAVVTGV